MKSGAYAVTHYFAYGSNMNAARMEARGLACISVLAGRLPGFGLRFNKRALGKTNVAYANIVYAPEHCVEGVLYQLADMADIALMDPFEGNPVRYSREIFPVTTDSGVINAWVYVANRAMLADGLLPERRYLDHLLAGYQWHSEQYHQWLSQHPTVKSEGIVTNTALTERDGLRYNG